MRFSVIRPTHLTVNAWAPHWWWIKIFINVVRAIVLLVPLGRVWAGCSSWRRRNGVKTLIKFLCISVREFLIYILHSYAFFFKFALPQVDGMGSWQSKLFTESPNEEKDGTTPCPTLVSIRWYLACNRIRFNSLSEPTQPPFTSSQ